MPHLIVMDIKMPRKTGLEVLEWIKKDGLLKRISVVIVSSSDQPSDINRAYELGANAYMVKPVDFQAVQDLFQSIIRYWGIECASRNYRSGADCLKSFSILDLLPTS